MKRFLKVFAFLPLLLFADAELAKNGKTDYSILLPSDAIPAEQTAAKEFQTFFRLSTGAKPEIVSETSGKRILIGQTPEISRLLGGLDFSTLAPDETIRAVRGDTLILTGGRPRGTLYAVETFLEETLGVRWWTPDETDVPELRNLILPEMTKRYNPAFRLRDVSYTGTWRNQNPLYTVRLKLNGWNTQLKEEMGGYVPLIGDSHSFYSLLPPSKYRAAHPEWYSGHQLCLTNTEMRRELTKNVMERIERSRAKGLDVSMVSVCQEDAQGWCECAECRKVIQEEGSLSGYLIRFVNQVAEEVCRVSPETKIVTFAYDLTTSPDFKTAVSDHVVIHIAPLGSDFGKPLRNSKANEKTFRSITGWAKKAKNILIWNYVADFTNYLVPHPNTGLIADDLKFFKENKAIGVFEQGSGLSNLDNMLPFRRWYTAQLLWNPRADGKKLREEFFHGYFGAGGKFLMEYLDKLDRAAADSGSMISCYHYREPAFMTDEFTAECRVLFEQAMEAVKGNEKFERRIRRERVQLDIITIMRHMLDHASTEELLSKGLGNPEELYSEFKLLAAENGLLFCAENQYLKSFLAKLETGKKRKTPEIPESFRNRTVFDLQFSSGYSDQNGVSEVIDPAASDNAVFRFDASFGGWGLMISPEKYSDLHKTGIRYWDIYLNIRAEGSGTDTPAFHMGAYSYEVNREFLPRTFRLDELKSEDYHLVFAGTLDISQDPQFWFGGPECRNGKVKEIRLDRVLMVEHTR